LNVESKLFTERIRFSVQGLNENTVGIFDASGRMLAAVDMLKGEGEWRPSRDVSPGVYFVKLLWDTADPVKIIYVK